jgi:hypothetical protein
MPTLEVEFSQEVRKRNGVSEQDNLPLQILMATTILVICGGLFLTYVTWRLATRT